MPDTSLLILGLNAMSRSADADYFTKAHRAGATLCAYYLGHAEGVEAGVVELLQEKVLQHWANDPQFSPLADEPPDPTLLRRIADAMIEHSSGLRDVGHNIILPTLSLKAFADSPAAITPTRVEALCRLVPMFKVMDVPLAEEIPAVPFEDHAAFASFVLAEFISGTERFVGRGQGWAGHLLTYAAAMMDLDDLGYADVAHSAREGFNLFVRRMRFGPTGNEVPREEHPPIDSPPTSLAYWQKKTGGDWQLGHVLKYPYAFHRVMTSASDAEVVRRAAAVAYRIF